MMYNIVNMSSRNNILWLNNVIRSPYYTLNKMTTKQTTSFLKINLYSYLPHYPTGDDTKHVVTCCIFMFVFFMNTVFTSINEYVILCMLLVHKQP